MGIFRPFVHAIRIIKFHGGLKETILQLLYTDTSKMGYLVGEDRYGNRYYQNDYYFFGRNRWVVYNRYKFGFDYDATHISCEYFNWIHHITDIPPCFDETRPKYRWQLEHTHNLTGTSQEYVPYSTVNQKIQPWVPKSVPCPPPVPPEPIKCEVVKATPPEDLPPCNPRPTEPTC